MTELTLSPSQILSIRDKVAIVTGGASGIGAATVKLLSDHGAHPWFCDINTTAGEAFAASVPSAHFIYADVSDWPSLYSFFHDVFTTTGRIDLVFANAGYIQPTSLWDDTFSPHTNILEPPRLTTLDITLKGAIYTAKLALFFFKQNPGPAPARFAPTITTTTTTPTAAGGGGSLIFTASSSSYNERPSLPLYSTAKHGVLGLMRSLRVNAHSQNIHVAAVAPGVTLTNMVPSSTASRMESAGVEVQSAQYVAMALVILASNPLYNGQCWALIGGRCTEVEGPLQQLMPKWYGEWHADQANRVTGVIIRH